MTATQTASTESKPAEARASAAQVESEVATHPLHAATGHTLAGGGGVHGVGEAPTTSLPHPLALFHRNIGNQAVLRSLSASRPIIQTKLTVNQPGDQYEREADRVAEQVMHKPDAGSVGLVTSNAAARGMQRKYHYGGSWDQSSDGVDVTNVTLQRAGTDDFGHVEAPPNAHEVLRSTGLPLDKATRAYFEPRFGVSLSDVRVHTDKSAEQSAADLGANAYTVGYDIVFGAGRFAPSVSEGRRLIAHELTHVIQQSSGGSPLHQVQCQPAPKSEDIKKLGPDGIPHATQRVRDKAETFYERAADGLKVFQETREIKDIEHSWWDKELVIAIAGLALGGFVSKLLSIEEPIGKIEEGEKIVREAVSEAWVKGIEAAMDEATKQSFADTLPEKTYPVVAFAEGQRRILLKLKDQERDQFDNKTSPSLHLKAKEHPSLVPEILAQLQQMLVDYDDAAKTAGKDQFLRTLDAWNVYMAKADLIPAKKERVKSETPLGEVVNEGAALLDFPPGVLRIECEVRPGLKTFFGWSFAIRGLNESLRSSFRGRAVRDVHVPQVALIHLTEPIRSFVIGRNEAGGFFLNASSDIRWALFQLAVPNWKQVAQDVREGRARPRPMERDMWEGARILMEQFIGGAVIDEIENLPAD